MIASKPRDQSRQREKLLPLIAFPAALFWMEMVVKLWDFGTILHRGVWYTLLFSISIGLVLTILCSVWSRRVNRVLSLVLLFIITVWYGVQAVYYSVMSTVFAVYSASVAGDATEFWRVGVQGAIHTMPALVTLLIPLSLFLILGHRYTPHHLLNRRGILACLLAAVLFHGGGVLSIYCSRGGILSPWDLYLEQSNPELSLSNFGVLTTLRLDIRRVLFPPKEEAGPKEEEPSTPVGSQPVQSEDSNVMDLTFATAGGGEDDAILRGMDQYFSSREPTRKNGYTGKFKGKNLIMITAEAFSSLAVDEHLTPTLYKLVNSGFVFQNYYNPLWWVSTSDGEYVACTSLIPKSGEQSFALSADNSLYFCLGNQFRTQGYDTRAYHNHTYTYYQRNKTHPNMGYRYKGLGGGLKLTEIWPESDLEMMQVTLPEYLNGDTPFHAYYMTVSGHLEYSFHGNSMAAKHKAEVHDLDLPEEAQAYLACQIELDRAMAYLLQELENAGQLENTVIALTGDHYPYGLSQDSIDALAGHPVEGQEIFKSNLILWSGDMTEPVVVDKTACSLDILPTLSNLFGLEYDSRLLMGRDIFSDSPGLAVFSDYSYRTDLGQYDAKTDIFTPNEGVTVPQEYPQQMLKEVQDMFANSAKVLEYDYYRRLGLEPVPAPDEGAPKEEPMLK